MIRTLGSGYVFGEIAVVSGGRRTATVVATAPLRLITVMNRDVWRLERGAERFRSIPRHRPCSAQAVRCGAFRHSHHSRV